ncbi:unnamed protein product [Sphagnum jensenii]
MHPLFLYAIFWTLTLTTTVTVSVLSLKLGFSSSISPMMEIAEACSLQGNETSPSCRLRFQLPLDGPHDGLYKTAQQFDTLKDAHYPVVKKSTGLLQIANLIEATEYLSNVVITIASHCRHLPQCVATEDFEALQPWLAYLSFCLELVPKNAAMCINIVTKLCAHILSSFAFLLKTCWRRLSWRIINHEIPILEKWKNSGVTAFPYAIIFSKAVTKSLEALVTKL